MSRKRYPSDLTDGQWAVLAPLVPPVRPGGRPRKHDMREVLNALFYVAREGCSWRALPHDLPPWRTAYNYFRDWQADGTWEALLEAARRQARRAAGRDPDPSAACIDSQSVKTAYGGRDVGTDGGKKVRGRKRHLSTDTLGFVLAVVVTAANVDDGVAAPQVFERMPGAEFPRLRLVLADSKYHNHDLYAWLRVHRRRYRVQVVSRPAGATGFVPLKKRWVVERTLAWLGRYRRLGRDHERRAETSAAMVQLSALHHTLRQLCPTRPRYRFRYRRTKRKVPA
jgi:putative transposase